MADAAEYGILDGADWGRLGDWRTQRTTESWTRRTRVDGADWGGLGWTGRTGLGRMGRSGGRGGLGWTGWTGMDGADWRTGRTRVDGVDWDGWGGVADGADWGGRGGWGGGGHIGSSLEGHKGRTGKPRAGVPADWADKLGCVRPGGLASSRLRAEGIPGVLSPDADYGVIWLHTPRIYIRFFGAHVIVLFLGTHTSKAQRPSTSDKFFGSLGALNITYSMFIQMVHAIRDIVIVSYKGGSSSLVPPSPLRTSCCS